MTIRLRVGAGCAAALLVTACGSSGTGDTARAPDPPLSRTEPYLVMTGATSGLAVWPSGPAWVLVSTRDGFAHVTNRTPLGVDTGGGLAVATTPDHVVAVVGAHERLLRSPVLTSGSSWRWDADELPGAVSGSRAAASVVPQTVVTTAHHGTLEARTSGGWRPLASAASLEPGLRLDAVTWTDSRSAWLTGTSTSGAAAYATHDGGATWSPVVAATGTDASALPPCGAGPSWVMPLLRDGSMSVLRTRDAGLHWTAGGALASAAAVFGCSGKVVWALAQRGGSEHLVASADDGATWRDRGAAPADIVDLCPTATGVGYAASGGGHPELWRVTDAGSKFTRIALPSWVASIGEQMSSDS